MFRPTYRSSSGLLTRQSVNAMHVGIPACLQDKVEKVVGQAQLIYCVFITGYMFRPTYRSSSGLLTRQSANAMHVGIPSCLQR